MTALPKRRFFTEEEYLLVERAAEYKSEYCDGEIYAMAGAGEPHILIGMNIGTFLHSQLWSRGCRVYTNDMRVRVADSGMYTYPDVVALCGEPRFLDGHRDTLLNPRLLVEILSPSTESYDRGEKVRRYRQIESLTDYLLVSQKEVLVEHGHRDLDQPHVWTVREYSQISDRLELGSLEIELGLQDIYNRIDFTGADFNGRAFPPR